LSGWLQVFRKELREFARDKRVLYTALIGPLMLEAMMILLFGYLMTTLSDKKRQETVLVYNEADGSPVLDKLRGAGVFQFSKLDDLADAAELLKKGKAKLVLNFPRGFKEKFEQRRKPEFEAIYDGNETTSELALEKLRKAVDFDRQLTRDFRLRGQNINPDEFDPYVLKERKADTGKPFAGTILISFLPYLIVLWAFYGGFSIVSDLVAGEKERGSLETLLVTPITRTAIAIGKFAALALLSLSSCLSAIVGVAVMGSLNLPITQKVFDSGLHLSAKSVLAIALAILPLVIFFSGILLSISTFARNQREVQGYLSMASFVVLIPAILSNFIGYTDAATSKWIAFVPVLNSATVIREALLDKVEWYNLLMTAAVGAVLAAIALAYAIRLFSKETVLLRT
jgi:sodium transport system permease protein